MLVGVGLPAPPCSSTTPDNSLPPETWAPANYLRADELQYKGVKNKLFSFGQGAKFWESYLGEILDRMKQYRLEKGELGQPNG